MNDWPRVRIGDLGQLLRGSGIRRNETVEAGKPCLRYGEIYTSFNYIFDKAKSYVPQKVYDDSLHIAKGDLVMALTGETKEEIAKTLAYLGDDEIAAGGDLAVWKNHGCDPKYLAYLMYTPEMLKAKAAASNGQIIVHASTKKLVDIEIPLPPLSNQHSIVARLEKELKAVEKAEAAFKSLAETAEAEFKAELGETFAGLDAQVVDGRACRPATAVKRVKLGEVCEKIGSGATPLGGKKTYREDGVSLIRSQNVLDLEFSRNGLAHISDIQAKKLDGVSVMADDVLLNITGDSVARSCLVDPECLPARVNQHVTIIRARKDAGLMSQFLNEALVAAKEDLLAESRKGATRKALTKDFLLDFSIPLPPLATQHSIVARLDAARERAEKLKAAAGRGMALAADMRKAILKEAFE